MVGFEGAAGREGTGGAGAAGTGKLSEDIQKAFRRDRAAAYQRLIRLMRISKSCQSRPGSGKG